MTNLGKKLDGEALMRLGVELTGLHENIAFEDYLKYDAISSSGISHLRKSPAHYQVYINEPHIETPAKLLGKLIHSAILEPEMFKQFAFAPEKFDKRTKEGKEKFNEWMAENHENTIVSKDDYETIQGILESCYKHPTMSKLLKGGRNEISGFWRDPITGVRCKMRIDKLLDSDVILDVKSCEDASLHGFKASINKYLYHIQSAFYLEGLGNIKQKVLSDFVHLAVEKKAPYGIGVYTLDDVSLAAGSDEVRKHLEIYDQCKKTNVWPCYPEDVQNISISPWLLEVKE